MATRARAMLWVLVAAGALAACGDSNDLDDGGDGGGGDGSGAGGGTVPDSPLVLDIQSAEVPESGRPTVTFKVTMPDGTAVNLQTEIGNANASPVAFPNTVPRFTVAALDAQGDHVSYYASDVAPRDYTPPAGGTPPPTGTFSQATYQPPPRDQAGPLPWPVEELEALGDGVYRVTLPETTVTGIDRTRTHTVAGWAVRTTEAGGEALIGYDAVHFLPSGSGTARTELAVNDAACASCHGFVQAHGTRRGVELCITCHSPQTTDPETSRTQDFKVLIHKVHAGSDLPSVRQGIPYFIVGFQQNVLDFSTVALPWYRGVGDCAICHNSAEDAGRFASQASLPACGSCHDNVRFDGSAGKTCGAEGGNAFDDCDHPAATPSTEPAACQQCHGADAVRGYHRQE